MKPFKANDLVYCDGKYSEFYPEGIYLLDCKSTLPNYWFLKSIDGRAEWCMRNGVPESHLRHLRSGTNLNELFQASKYSLEDYLEDLVGEQHPEARYLEEDFELDYEPNMTDHILKD